MIPALCDFEGAHWLLFSSNVPPLVYYSHFSVLIIALVLSLFIYFNNRHRLQNKIFSVTLLLFAAWVFLDSIFWATNRSDLIMFAWATVILIEPFIYAGALYFLYVAIFKKDMPLWGKLSIGALLLPLIIAAPTDHTLTGFDLSSCLSTEGFFAIQYVYPLELLLTIIAISLGLYAGHKKKDLEERKQIYTLTVGIFCFLLAFAWGNITGSFTENWQLGQFGLIGMPIAAAFLTYAIVRFHAFQIKIAAVNVLVVGLWILVLSLLFADELRTVQMIVAATFLVLIPFGILLIRSVKREIKLREQLEIANKRQQETLRFITHEVKGYLTDGAAALDALLNGLFGPITDEMHTMLAEAMAKNRNALREIQNFLRIADFKTGKVTYAVETFDFKDKFDEVIPPLAENAKNKGLVFKADFKAGNYKMTGDSDQLINHVIGNLIHNSINYTQSGSVTVGLEKSAQGGSASGRKDDVILVSVKDTGVGLSEDDKALLFTEGGHGKESRMVNPHSTGYGLYIAKRIVDAHKGRIWAESEGRGKGSTFFVELPSNLSPKDFTK